MIGDLTEVARAGPAPRLALTRADPALARTCYAMCGGASAERVSLSPLETGAGERLAARDRHFLGIICTRN